MAVRLAKHDERNIHIKYEERGLIDRAGQSLGKPFPACFPPSPLLDCDYLHADAVAFADVIFDGLEPMLLQKSIKPFAGKIVIMLNLPPIGIDAIGVQQSPNHVLHVWHRQEKNAALTQ